MTIQTDNETDFDALFRQWYAPLVRYAAAMTEGDIDEAEDLVQQVFVKYWEQQTTIQIQFSPKAYLYKMVYNRALNRIRDAKTRDRFINDQTRKMADAHIPPSDLNGSELESKYKKTLNALPTQCRQVFELSRFEDLKYREIADHLGISIKTVETHMGKALKILRVELAEFLTLFALCFLF